MSDVEDSANGGPVVTGAMIWAGMQERRCFSEHDAEEQVLASVYLAMAEAAAKPDVEVPQWLRSMRVRHRASR